MRPSGGRANLKKKEKESGDSRREKADESKRKERRRELGWLERSDLLLYLIAKMLVRLRAGFSYILY